MKKKRPALRFSGFDNDWEQRKLGDVADKVIEKNADLTVQETFTNSAEFGVVSQRDFFDHDITNVNNIGGYYVVKNEDFVYNPRISVTAPVGPVNRNKLGRDGVISPLYTVFRTHDIDTTYLDWFFKSGYWHSFMYFNGDSGARSDRFSIKDSVFFEMPIPMPTLKEQRKIGAWMDSLDHLITLHRCECKKLICIKKSMLENMFPQKGEKIPRIRFSGFTDDWEQRKLGDVSDSYSGGTPTADVSEYYGGQIPFIRSAEINSVITELFLTEGGLKNSSARLVEMGDILYALYGATSGEVGRARLTGAINQAILAIKPHGGYDSEYIAQWLRKSKHSIIETYLQGGQGNLSGAIVKELSVDFPTLKEQQVIGVFFKQLDHLITLHQRKLEKLQNIKKAMLEKMFV